jgi:mono/diheme cytochrome c family protein
VAITAVLGSAVPAAGQGDPVEGRALAERLCAECHAVGRGPSPVVEAMPFDVIAQQWPPEYLAEALAEGIVAGHQGPRMPVFVLQQNQIDDMVAHLQALRAP